MPFRFVEYLNQTSIPRPITSVFPEGWRGFETDNFKAPLAAKLQRWETFGPAGTIVSKFPEGWRGLQLEAKVAPRFPVALQKWDSFQPFQATAAAFAEGWRGLDDGLFSDYYIIYQQTSLVPFTPPSFNDYYSFQLDYRLKAPLAAAQQKWDAWPAQVITTPVTTVEGWRGFETDAFKPRLNSAQQQWAAYPPQITITPQGWGGSSGGIVKSRSVLEEGAGFTPQGTIVSVFPEGWRGLQLETRFTKPLPVGLQRWDYWLPQVIISVFPEGWRGFETDAFKSALAAALQRWEAFEPQGTIGNVVFVEGWRGHETDAFKAAFGSAQQKWEAFSPAGTITSKFPEGWRGLQLDVRTRSPFNSAQQQWAAYTPQIIIVPQGWGGSSGGIVKSRSILEEGGGFPLFVAPTAKFPEGWRGLDDGLFSDYYVIYQQTALVPFTPPTFNDYYAFELDFAFKRPLSPAQQRWETFQPQGTIVPATIFKDGWRGLQLDSRLAKPFPAAAQRWEAFEPRGVIPVTGVLPDGWRGLDDVIFSDVYAISDHSLVLIPQALPEGWRGLELDYRFANPFPAMLQQPSAFMPRGTVIMGTFPDGWRGLELGFRIAKPFPASMQQFGAFSPQGTIVTKQAIEWILRARRRHNR